MEYKILTGGAAWQVTERTQSAIKSGWTPQGGVTVAKDGFSLVFAQAMIKRTMSGKL